jgi:hypothetical protein
MCASLTYILKTKGSIFQGVGVAKAYLDHCDVGRETQCGLHGVAEIKGCKAQRGSQVARCSEGHGTLGAGLDVDRGMQDAALNASVARDAGA